MDGEVNPFRALIDLLQGAIDFLDELMEVPEEEEEVNEQ